MLTYSLLAEQAREAGYTSANKLDLVCWLAMSFVVTEAQIDVNQ